MNTHKLALCALALVSAFTLNAFAQNQNGFRSKAEAIAACKTLIEQDGQADTDKDVLSTSAALCREVVKGAFQAAAQMGSEYMVFGIGLFGGAEVNTPQIVRLNGAGNLQYGLTAWATYNEERHEPDLRLTPLFQALGGAKANTKSSVSSLLEFSRGFVVFYGKDNKSILDFNGAYTGASLEFQSPLVKEGKVKRNWQGTVLTNFKGSYAYMGFSTISGGNPGLNVGAHEMWTYNWTEDGRGFSVRDNIRNVEHGAKDRVGIKH